MTESAALFRIANARIMDYPIEFALESALDVCEEAVVVIAQSEDDTHELIYELRDTKFGPHRMSVVEDTFVFDRGWQERWWEIASSVTNAEWLLWLDADEIIHQNSIPLLHDLMSRDDIKLINFPFVHFYGTGNHTIEMSVKNNTRLGRRSAGYRMVNWCSDKNPNRAACAAVFDLDGTQRNAHSYRGDGVAVMERPIYHYGWCRDAVALAISQKKHHAWYADGGGLEDGHIPEVEPFPFDMTRKDLLKWTLGHPKYILPWLFQHEEQWKMLTSEVAYA